MSFKILSEKIKQKQNPTVMGLDPLLDYIPNHIKIAAAEKFDDSSAAAGEAIFNFNKALIDAVCDQIPAVKPQSAFYEMYGIDGLIALKKTAMYARSKGLYVIIDAKRGDIGSTAEAYSSAYLGETSLLKEKESFIACDCMTVNPYLGIDGIKPFLDNCVKYDKSIFILVKTSNKSSGDFQDIIIKDKEIPLYEIVAQKVTEWGRTFNIKNERYNPAGAVIGATYPKQLEILRAKMPDTFFLIPGFGAQGGNAGDVKAAFNKDGTGAIVNSSRAIMCAYQKKESFDERNFAEYAREEVLNMKKALNEIL